MLTRRLRSTGTLEHLLPQSSNLPIAHSIGNLILVPAKFNGDVLGNKPFAEKRTLLQTGGYPVDKDVSAAAQWGAREIEKRLTSLAEFAYDQVWKIK